MPVAPSLRTLVSAGLALLASGMAAGDARAQFSLARQWEGPFDYVATATTLRTQSNSGNACAVASSTSATVAGIPVGATVDAAYLYWAGSGSPDATVTFAGSAVTADRTATDTYLNGNTVLAFFGAVRDVTGQVSGNGTYTLSGLSVTTGGAHCTSQAVMGGWGLVVVYRQPGAAPRRIQLRDGLFTLRYGTETISLTGFTGAASPSVRLTYLVHEGDPDQTGDWAYPERVYFNGTSLTNNNAFNSTVLGTTNRHGVDMDSYAPALAAGATGATLQLASGSDLVLPQVAVTSIAVAPEYGVRVTPDGLASPVRRLPGTGYAQPFWVVNRANLDVTYDLLLAGSGTPFFAVLDSVRAPGLVTTARPDSARLTVAYGDSVPVTLWYSVAPGDTATNTGTLRARTVPQPATADEGWAQVRRVSPSLALAKSVSPQNTLAPGTELTYTLALSNEGEYDARGVTVTDAVPPQVTFKLGSVTQALPPGISAAASYSSDGGATWSYVPVSGGCGAPAGHDGCVQRIRWTLAGDLPPGADASAGTLTFATRIR